MSHEYYMHGSRCHSVTYLRFMKLFVGRDSLIPPHSEITLIPVKELITNSFKCIVSDLFRITSKFESFASEF